MSSPIATCAGALVADHPRERRTDVGDEALVELVADQATHVIRLDDTVDCRGGPGHGSPSQTRDCWRQPIRSGEDYSD